MASTATTRNRLNKQGTGDNTGTWGAVLNEQALDMLDEALDGVTTLTVSGNVTLTSANYVSDQSRRRILKLTGSPGASYTITIPGVEKFYFVINQSNAAQIIKAGGIGYSIPSGAARTVACDGTDCYGPESAVPYVIGAVIDYAGSSALVPTGWILCNGAAISRATYAGLFGVISIMYGAGNGTTTFNVPDFRGRVSVGVDLAAGRIPSFSDRGISGGTETVTLDIANMPAHDHGGVTGTTDPAAQYLTRNSYATASSGSTNSIWQDQAVANVTSDSHSHTIASQGSGTAFSNVQPSLTINKIIYAGV
jgi:microcystin-dependent protein